jgi:hypothetical protein
MWAIYQGNISLPPSAPMAPGRQQYENNNKRVSEKVLGAILRF